MVVVGWEYGTGVSTAPATSERYITAFTEELWRRNLSTAYDTHCAHDTAHTPEHTAHFEQTFICLHT